MIETLFAGVNGYTVVPGKKNFYPTNQDSFHEVKLNQGDNLELIYENGFYDTSFTPQNVQDADPASIISATDYGTWTYNILIPKQFLKDFIASLNGYDSASLAGGRESLIIQSALDALYELYKSQVSSDKLVDFVPWLVGQINAYVAKNFLTIYISDYNFPSVRKIQYIDQNNSITADTNQGSQFGISSTKYILRKNMAFREHSEKFYRLAISVVTDPAVFDANKYRTDLTINNFDIHSLRVEDFYVIHPKSHISEFKPLDSKNAIINRGINVQFDDSTNQVQRTAHGLENGQLVSFSSIVTTTGINKSSKYYIVNADSNSFQLSLTLGGGAINLTNDGYGTLIYETSVPLTISNYPELEVFFGNSRIFNKPTLVDYSRKEDLNMLDRSLTLKESLYGFSNIKSANYQTSGNAYINVLPMFSESGYALTGNTIAFQESLLKRRSVESGIYDKDATDSSVYKFLQIGFVETSFDLLHKAQAFDVRKIDPILYAVDPQANSTGQFKAANESYFFGGQSLTNAQKSGIYLKVRKDVTEYMRSNMPELVDKTRKAISNETIYNIYRVEAMRALGSYGTSNMFYINSGFETRLNANFYLYVQASPFNFNTNSCRISSFGLRNEHIWDESGINRYDLGMTENTRWVVSGVTYTTQ